MNELILSRDTLVLGIASIFLIGICAGVLLVYGLGWLQQKLEEVKS